MNGNSSSPSALIISNDQELIDLLKTSNTTDQEFRARESIQVALEDAELLAGNGIVIVDLAVNDNDVSTTISQLVRLKRHDPSQVLIIVGDPAPLGEILKSNIQPIIYRAFNKPIHPNQIFLAFDHANDLHEEQIELMAAGAEVKTTGLDANRPDLDAISNNRPKNSVVYLALGIVAAGILAWLLYDSQDSAEPDSVAEGTVVIEDSDPNIEEVFDIEEAESVDSVPIEEELDTVKALNAKASEAFAAGRFVSPKGDNALEYYQQALTLDPYDSVAYQGKNSIAGAMRTNYQQFVDNAQFDRALATIKTLQEIEPLNQENDQLHKKLENSIEEYASRIQATGTPEQIKNTTAILTKMETSFDNSKSAASALIKEQGLIKQIDAAINSDNLVPPGKNNAYSLVSASLRNNAISKANSEPRVAKLGGKLLAMANNSLTSSDLAEAEKLAALVRRLNGKSPELSELNQAINTKKKAAIEAEKALAEKTVAIAKESPEVEVAVEPVQPKIIPAVVVNRPSPRYPRVALNRGITGWVDLAFTIDAKGKTTDVRVIGAEPSKVFDDVAIRAVKRWQFKPARNEDTGEAVESTVEKSRLNFQLSE